MKIMAALEDLSCRPGSLEDKLRQLGKRTTGVLEELAAERKKMLQKENAKLEPQLKSILLGTQGSSFHASLR